MENLGIILITCGLLVIFVGPSMQCNEKSTFWNLLGLITFLLGLLSTYVGIALLVSLWMLIIVPVFLVFFIPATERHHGNW